MFKMDLEKEEEPETIKKAREFQKNVYFCFIDYAKAFDWVDQDKLQTSYILSRPPASWEICMQVKKQ